ncbi:hypothetical protein ACQ38_gp13 [Proteus phage PM 93]|uniref:Uncharacterized protein n=1 Tax=Proteus phage PM 93 TaxID=1560284 RepID=A0A0F6NYD3_9CAUD|nr:hypothetical protein ACQ38_gp13 [Proteus phage PM 93]AIW03135.1 hypothetical protein PM93_0013 [Proteus phage PM 93]
MSLSGCPTLLDNLIKYISQSIGVIMYQLNLNVGSKVRNIREHSSYKGMLGFVECEINEGKGDKWLVQYQDGRRGTYFKHLAHHSLQLVDEHKSVKQTIKEQPKSERIMIKRERRNVIAGWTQSEMIKIHGHVQGVVTFNQRALGKTTGQALSVISKAILQPNIPVSFHNIDHAIVEHNVSPKIANINMKQKIENLIKTLGFEGVSFNNNNSIIFNPLVTVETYVERV